MLLAVAVSRAPHVSRDNPSLVTRVAHRAAFFRNWLAHPFSIASIAPTGQSFARLMASGLGPGHRVLELGAGTGAITQAILATGVRPDDLWTVELNKDFVRILKSRFPRTHILHADAESLRTELADLHGSMDFVISGLPILWFSKAKQARILSDAFQLLRPAGCFHQVTYWARPPVSRRLLEGLDLKTSRLGFSALNLPPAFAFCWQRVGAGELTPALAHAGSDRTPSPRRAAGCYRAGTASPASSD